MRTLLILALLGMQSDAIPQYNVDPGINHTQGLVGIYVPDVPQPTWVPDPSAGHYDCPEGWTAYKREEPYKYSSGPIAAPFISPNLDAKGHLLGYRPAAPICIKDK